MGFSFLPRANLLVLPRPKLALLKDLFKRNWGKKEELQRSPPNQSLLLLPQNQSPQIPDLDQSRTLPSPPIRFRSRTIKNAEARCDHREGPADASPGPERRDGAGRGGGVHGSCPVRASPRPAQEGGGGGGGRRALGAGLEARPPPHLRGCDLEGPQRRARQGRRGAEATRAPGAGPVSEAREVPPG